jgi:hypothetical protein
MPLRRRRRRLDTTPCTVQVVSGRLVYHDGQQRSGELHNVPKYLAMRWLRQRYASIVTWPAGAGDSPHRPSAGHPERSLVRSPDASPPQPQFADDDDESLLDSSAPADDEQADEAADTANCDKTAGRGTIPSPDASPQPRGSADFGPFASQEIGLEVCQDGRETVADQRERQNDGRGEPVRTGESTRTRARANPYGKGRCGNCGSPVSGRRRWCDEACRLRAYRASRPKT